VNEGQIAAAWVARVTVHADSMLKIQMLEAGFSLAELRQRLRLGVCRFDTDMITGVGLISFNDSQGRMSGW
jgi:hypothetical protein